MTALLSAGLVVSFGCGETAKDKGKADPNKGKVVTPEKKPEEKKPEEKAPEKKAGETEAKKG